MESVARKLARWRSGGRRLIGKQRALGFVVVQWQALVLTGQRRGRLSSMEVADVCSE
jgi:hypothetical protein